jgi:hypothetical protein
MGKNRIMYISERDNLDPNPGSGNEIKILDPGSGMENPGIRDKNPSATLVNQR